MIREKRSILCVDDEERDLELQRATFEAGGFHVSVARDLSQVNCVLDHLSVDAVVLDYRLMNADPIHVAISVRKRHPRMPIMLLSGYVEEIPEYFKRAVDACVAKQEHGDIWLSALRLQFATPYGNGAVGI